MKNKKIGIGSLSLLLVIIAFVWAFNIFGVCVGDHILATLNIPTWSNMANATGTHYTIFYSFIFLIYFTFVNPQKKIVLLIISKFALIL